MVDRIEAASFCARRANPNDRRSSLVELTPTGQQALDQATTVFDRELEERIGGLPGFSRAADRAHTQPWSKKNR